MPAPARSFDVWHEVPLVPQLTGMSCWAAAAAMVVGWRECVDVRPEDVAAGLGRWDAYRAGLEPSDVDDLARVFGLVVEPARTYSVEGLRRLLESAGPLWLGEAVPGLHVVVAAGLYGDGTPDGSWVRVADPWPMGKGERYRVRFRELAANLAEASTVVGATAQILHAGGRRARFAGSSPWLRGDAAARLAPPPALRGPGAIVIDPGHGGWRPVGRSTPIGARGAAGTREKDVTLAIARRLAARLGPAAQLTRDRDVNLSLADRAARARRAGAGVFVSIHVDGHADGPADRRADGDGGRADGRVLHRTAAAYVHREASWRSRDLAGALQRELAVPGADPLEGVALADDLAVLHPGPLGDGVAACLLEVDTLSHPAGEERLRDPIALDDLADRLAGAIRGHQARLTRP